MHCISCMQSLFLLYHNWKCVQDIGLIFNLVTHKDSDSETDSKSFDFESDSSFKDNLYTKKALFKCKNGKICVLRSGAKILILVPILRLGISNFRFWDRFRVLHSPNFNFEDDSQTRLEPRVCEVLVLGQEKRTGNLWWLFLWRKALNISFWEKNSSLGIQVDIELISW